MFPVIPPPLADGVRLEFIEWRMVVAI